MSNVAYLKFKHCVGHTEKLLIVYLTFGLNQMPYILSGISTFSGSIALLLGCPQYHSLNPDSLFQNGMSPWALWFCPSPILTASHCWGLFSHQDTLWARSLLSVPELVLTESATPIPGIHYHLPRFWRGSQFLLQPQELDLRVHQGEGARIKLDFFRVGSRLGGSDSVHSLSLGGDVRQGEGLPVLFCPKRWFSEVSKFHVLNPF